MKTYTQNHLKMINVKMPYQEAFITLLSILILISCWLIIKPSYAQYAQYAQTVETQLATSSYGELKSTINDELKQNIILSNNAITISDQQLGKATGKLRNLESTAVLTSLNKQAKASTYITSFDVEFMIYNAQTYLEEDIDGDGYFKTFSLVFDADINSYNGIFSSEVYADIYLSKNGGNWQHIFTTDYFLIVGDNSDDEYEIITTLLSNYSSDHYDVLIDLYQVGNNSIVATYSSDDNNSLYALPLESAEFDQPYTEVYVDTYIEHGGSFSLIILLSLLAMYIRKFNCLETKIPR